MNKFFKFAILSVASVPVMASATTYLDVQSWGGFPYSIDGQGGGGPFGATLLNSSMTVIDSGLTVYCDSVPQHMGVPQTFQVTVEDLNVGGAHQSLDPWVIQQANNEATAWDTANTGQVPLTYTQIQTAIQGVIWFLDDQVNIYPMVSSDSETGEFANFLLSDAQSKGTYITGYAKYSADINYADGQTGDLGQSQVGLAPTPEPSSLFALGLPLIGFAVRKRKSSR